MHLAEKGEGVVVLLFLIMVSGIMASLSWFLNHLMEDHPIGQSYLLWLQKLPVVIAKPLGECVYCSGAWQYLFASFFIFNLEPYLCLIGLGANHLFLHLLKPQE